MKRICVLTDRYPLPEYPANTFLEQLVNQFADMGIECDVIVPYCPFMDILRRKTYKPVYHDVRFTKKGNAVHVYSPTFFCLAGRDRFGIAFSRMYIEKHYQAALRTIKKIRKEYDCFYAHFIVPAALNAAQLGNDFGKPVFFAYGESSIQIVSDRFCMAEIQNRLAAVTGAVAVSTKNKNELIYNKLMPEDKIGVFPNSIDNTRFYVMDKSEVRKSLGIEQQAFVVAFVGHFINRKGSKRLSASLEQFDDVKSIFIGAGEEAPTCNNIIFSGRLPHNEIAKYLNAADVFVLPTLAEGCCNAIVEAMACGLPIISSDLPFNDDILDEENSVRIDPNDIQAIADAIRMMKDSPELRKEKSAAALRTAQRLSIQRRAENILAFMEEKMKK